jgi:glycosyltransferase involved in cell wall biosynthesis
MPAVSVIMPTWNPGAFLAASVDSILNQTMADLELVIVDDGSTDGEVERVLAARPDPRIRLIRNPKNVGIGASYTAAIPTCSSPWIAVIDSDDIAHPMRLEMQLKALSADRSLDAIATTIEIIDRDGHFLESYPSFHSPAEIKAYALIVMPIPHPTLMARAELFKEVGYRSEVRSAADYDMVLRALDKGYRIGSLSIPLYYYRRHSTSTTTVRNREHLTFVCLIQLCAARRRAGRPEQLGDLVKEADALVGSSTSLARIYCCYSAASASEGQPVLAAVHAAFSIRSRPTVRGMYLLAKNLLISVGRDRGSLRPVFAGLLKGLFAALLLRDAKRVR